MTTKGAKRNWLLQGGVGGKGRRREMLKKADRREEECVEGKDLMDRKREER